MLASEKIRIDVIASAATRARAMLMAAPEAELVYRLVTKAVCSPKNDKAEVVEPITLP